MDTAGWYRYFAEVEAAGSSVAYRVLANGVADDAVLLGHLEGLPGKKRQPNLLFAAVQFLDGPTDSWTAFRSFVLDDWARVAGVITARSTQTNEAARCAALLPVLGSLRAPIALIEVGASAGLCLLPDRYSYSYSGTTLGDSPVHIDVEATGPVPIPVRLPDICWRAGVDRNPLDITDPDDVAWLRACVWPEHRERRERLDGAVAIARANPPEIVRGDLNEEIDALIDSAPKEATTVVFHSAVLSYLSPDQRQVFADKMRRRPSIVWISNEAPGVVAGLGTPSPREPNAFVLGRNGDELLAHTDPHGRWLTWA
ncbi:MAG: DUF2332 domain-containing protein [Ilumatobacter sp.]|uniref:DUF2332 domain-containing protein n=1 Tax=Ilumatobacter sp. TaxID=1967498 RepID=UPI003C76AA67